MHKLYNLGPIIEGVDNNCVTDHFRTTYLDPGCLTKNIVTEKEITDLSLPGERYVGITVSKAAYVRDFDKLNVHASIDKEELKKIVESAKVIDELKSVLYYYRANRGGRGIARVGLKWTW